MDRIASARRRRDQSIERLRKRLLAEGVEDIGEIKDHSSKVITFLKQSLNFKTKSKFSRQKPFLEIAKIYNENPNF